MEAKQYLDIELQFLSFKQLANVYCSALHPTTTSLSAHCSLQPAAAMGLSPLTKFILKRPWLTRWMVPLSKWYATRMGYRQLGLRYEDLLPEESETMQKALKRLPPKEAYDRVFRLRRAFQVRCTLAIDLGSFSLDH